MYENKMTRPDDVQKNNGVKYRVNVDQDAPRTSPGFTVCQKK